MVNIQRILVKTAKVFDIPLDDSWFEPEVAKVFAAAAEPPLAEPVSNSKWDYVGQCEIEGAPV